MSQIKCNVGNATIRIAAGHGDSDSAIFDYKTNSDGTQGWPVPYWPAKDYTLHVNDRDVVPGYGSVSVYVPQPANGQYDDISITLPAAPLTRISANGFDLKDESGARFFAKGCTDFLLYQRFLNGEDIQPILAERSGLGANILRVFGMVDSFSHWHPQDYGDRYYTQIQAFCDLLASYRLYVYFTVFADTRLVMPNTADQVRHWDRVVEALKASPNTIVEVGNELDQHDNAVDANLQRPSGILACRGSYGGQPAANPPMITPDWDLGDFHARRDYPKAIVDMPVVQLQTGDTTDGVSHRVPIWHGEPQGFGPNPKRWQSPHKARELAGTARGTACGVYFHSDAGVKSELFDDTTKACAVAFFQELAGL